MPSAAEVVRSIIVWGGRAAYPGLPPVPGSLLLDCHVAKFPDQPLASDECLVCGDTAGKSFGRIMKTGTVPIHPGVKLLGRFLSANYARGHEVMEDIRVFINGLVDNLPLLVQIRDQQMNVGSVHCVGNVISLGEEQGGTRRCLFSLNLRLAFNEPASTPLTG